jgi:hypothetical protein
MDPITLATLTAAVSHLAAKVIEGVADDAGADLWGRIKARFRWESDPPLSDLAPSVAAELAKSEELARDVIQLLQERQETANLVGNIDAEKVVVAQTLNVSGDFHM